MLDVTLTDVEKGRRAKITQEGALNVILHPHPPVGEPVIALPFRRYLTDTGVSTGSSDMRVNGAATPQEFYISASTLVDIYIGTLSVQISDNGAALNKFGALTALSNGVEFIFDSSTLGEIVIHEGAKTNLDMVRLGTSTAAIGSGTSAFKADISGGGADTYLPLLDFEDAFGLQYGVRLSKNSNDRLLIRINDDISTGIDQFDMIAYGLQI